MFQIQLPQELDVCGRRPVQNKRLKRQGGKRRRIGNAAVAQNQHAQTPSPQRLKTLRPGIQQSQTADRNPLQHRKIAHRISGSKQVKSTVFQIETDLRPLPVLPKQFFPLRNTRTVHLKQTRRAQTVRRTLASLRRSRRLLRFVEQLLRRGKAAFAQKLFRNIQNIRTDRRSERHKFNALHRCGALAERERRRNHPPRQSADAARFDKSQNLFALHTHFQSSSFRLGCDNDINFPRLADGRMRHFCLSEQLLAVSAVKSHIRILQRIKSEDITVVEPRVIERHLHCRAGDGVIDSELGHHTQIVGTQRT